MYEKKLLFDRELLFLRKPTFRIILFTLFSFLMAQSSFAQQWAILGNESQISTVASSFTSIAVLNDVPYVVYREGTISKVKMRNSAGVWEQLGDNIGTNLTYTRIYFDKANNLLVTYVDASNGNKLAVKTYNVNDQVWQPLNNDVNNLYVSSGQVTNTVSQYGTTPRSSLAFDSDNTPYIAYGDGATLTPYVKKFDGNSWVTVGSAAVDPAMIAVGVSLVIDEADVPWLAFCKLASATSSTGTMALYQFSAGTWKSIAITVTAAVRHTSMVLNSANNLTIAYFNTGDTNRATVIEYNKNAATPSWSAATRLGSRDSPSLSLIRDIAGSLYCSFIDNVSSTATFSARVFKQAAGTSAWTEMKDPTVVRGIDEPVSNLTIAAGSAYPFVVYTKNNSGGISTPIVRQYTPPPPPAILSTQDAANITAVSAESGGDITFDGGSAITERGIVYSTGSNPTIANTKVKADTAGLGAFTVSISGLNPATLYYVRAYAINNGGASYGDNVRLSTLALPDEAVTTPKQMEFLNRGVVAVRKSSSQVFISWRLLGNEPSSIAFNIYRDNVKLNNAPITASTNFLDDTSENGIYTIKSVLNDKEGKASNPASVWANNQLSVPLQIPQGGTTPDGKAYTYTANDASVGDVDGDGEYEIFLKWDPTVVNDNAGGYSGEQIFDCYKMDGTKLWRINLGKNVNAGPHYNPFMVYDFDGDGKAEMFLKTADGTIDGLGNVIGDANVDYRNTSGWVQQGPEWLTVFNGLTGAAMQTVSYQPARANTADWGDSYGNRQDRFVSAVAYLDGSRPSLIVGRGYYDKLVRAAYDWRDGKITLRWIFDSKDPNDPANNALSSQGNHQMTVGDVDGDGKDEIINGSSAINDDGKRLWTYGQGHGDALHMSDMDPDRPGLEIWQCLESPSQYSPYGIRLNDAKTGKMIFGVPTTGDVGRALAADIDPAHRGYEMWSSSGNLYNVQDGEIGTAKPTGGSQSVNAAVWWDGDLGRELLDGTIMDKWNPTTKTLNRLFTIYQAAPVSSNNSTKKNPCLTGDIFGDWREEIILRRTDNTALIIFTTNIPTDNRIHTLMHDPQYRTAIAWQNSGYNQPPHPSFFLGYDMAEAPTPNIEVKYISAPEVKNTSVGTRAEGCDAVVDYVAEADAFPVPNYTYVLTGATTATGDGTGSGSTFNKGVTMVTVTASNSSGTVTYSFEVTVEDLIAPVLTVPATQFLCHTETYIVPALEATDNCAIASVTFEISGATQRSGEGTDASGSFNVGVSTITWTVTDTAGNQTIGKTEVIVNALLSGSIPEVYVMDKSVAAPNTIYRGYGPDSLTLNAIAEGGTAPYTYSWSSGEEVSFINVSNAGTYTVTITDAKGCTQVASMVVNVVDVSCGINNKQVVVCFKGKSVCVLEQAVPVLLKLGWTLGQCEGSTESPLFDFDLPLAEAVVYPNPSNGYFNLQLSGYKSNKVTLVLTNSIGQALVKREVQLEGGNLSTSVTIPNPKPGVYFLRVISGQDIDKIIKIFVRP